MAKLKNTTQNGNAMIDVTRKIANIDLMDDITVTEMVNSLKESMASSILTGQPNYGDKILYKHHTDNSGYIVFESGFKFEYLKNVNVSRSGTAFVLPCACDTIDYLLAPNLQSSSQNISGGSYSYSYSIIDNAMFKIIYGGSGGQVSTSIVILGF